MVYLTLLSYSVCDRLLLSSHTLKMRSVLSRIRCICISSISITSPHQTAIPDVCWLQCPVSLTLVICLSCSTTIRRRTLGSRTSRAAESGPKLGNGKIIVCLYEHPCPRQWRFSSPINMFGLQGSLPSMQILLALIIDFSSSLFLSTCCFQRTHICWALHMSEVKWFRDASTPYISGSEGCLSIDPH